MSAALWREENKWSQQDELAAALIELTDISSRRVVAALGGEIKGDPIRIERPSQERLTERKITTDTREIAQWFAAHSEA